MSAVREVLGIAEGDMRRVYDHALVIHEMLSRRDRVSLDMQNALSWSAYDLLTAGADLRKHCDALYEADKADRQPPQPSSSDASVVDDILTRLSMQDLHNVYSALGTIFDVACGLLSQPRFSPGDGTVMTEAAEVIDRAVSDPIAVLRDKIYSIAEKRPAETGTDRDRKFALLADRFVDGISNADVCLKEIAGITAKLGEGGAS